MKDFLEPHDSSWEDKFSKEAIVIAQALGENTVAIHHIGSTSIPNIVAKPVIDVLVGATCLDVVDQCSDKMGVAGYEIKGAYGIEGRRYFRKSNAIGGRMFHVHVYEHGSAHITRHIAFRDFLLAHPERAAQYSDLKMSLVSGEVISRQTYQREKEPFLSAMEIEFLEWFAREIPI